MAENENQDGAQITSARKELKFDDKSGRFFETGLDTEECIPDEEFCMVNEEDGNRIRLTVAEKERIFLDSLQVRVWSARIHTLLLLQKKPSNYYGKELDKSNRHFNTRFYNFSSCVTID